MASIRGPFGGAQVAGSISSTVFSRNRAGAYVRARSVPVNPQSPLQVAIRQSMSGASNAWVTVLTAMQRAAWEDYAEQTKLPDRFGELVNVGGRQMFLRTNNARDFAGIGTVLDAPSTPGVAPSVTSNVTGDTTNGIEYATVTPTLAAGDVVIVRLGVAVNQSVNFYAAPYSFVAGVVAATGQPVLLKPPAEVAIGQRYFIEDRFFQADGKVSFIGRQFVDILA